MIHFHLINKSDISGVVFEDIDHNDYPDYCDAYISEACYMGEPMTNDEIDALNEDSDLVYDLLMDYLN